MTPDKKFLPRNSPGGSDSVEPNQNVSISSKPTVSVTVFNATDQELIQTTADKARIVLREYTDRLRTSSGFLRPLELALSVTLALLTTTFRSFLGIEAYVWSAIFYVGAVGSWVWLVITVWNARRVPKIEDVVKVLKGQQDTIGGRRC